MYSFVSEKNIIDSFKKSKYFKVDLGKVFMSSKDGEKKFDFSDQSTFIQHYFANYKSKLYKEGNIGEISFYTDYAMRDTVVVFYDDVHDFVFEHNAKQMLDKGVDSYLGAMIKEIETKHIPTIKGKKQGSEIPVEERIKTAAEKIKNNPGNISYDDIKDYLKTKRRI